MKTHQTASTNDVQHVLDKIRRLALTGVSQSPRTCYHQVGLYLHRNPDTKGNIYLYGLPRDPESADDGIDYVAHATLLSSTGQTLVDAYGRRQPNPRRGYVRDDGQMYELLKVVDVEQVLPHTASVATASAAQDMKPPASVAEAARRGLELRKQHGRGGTAVGVARARDLSNRKNLSPQTVRRMKAYFDRHQGDKPAGGWDHTSAGYIAWMLWGGDAGYSWARKMTRSLDSSTSSHQVSEETAVMNAARMWYSKIMEYLMDCDDRTVRKFKESPDRLRRALLIDQSFADLHNHLRWATPDIMQSLENAVKTVHR